MNRVSLLLAAVAAAAACSTNSTSTSSSSSSSGGGGATSPAAVGFDLVITSPQPGSTVAVGTDPELTVPIGYTLAVTVDGGLLMLQDGGYDDLGIPFELTGPGACNGRSSCGHVALVIDDGGCNQPGLSYNDVSAYGPMPAELAFCCTPTGPHTFDLTLVDDQGQPVTEGGVAVTAQVQATIAGPLPSYAIPCTCMGVNACADAGTSIPDGGSLDGGPGDGGVLDGGSMDGGSMDGGSIDGGAVDGGQEDGGADAGLADAGSADGGSLDGGMPDAGSADAGPADAGGLDAGSPDGGPADAGGLDAGSSDAGAVDAGTVDAGLSDAGPIPLDGGGDGG